eukprot:m.115433 g.115433  ORF g.115433 m.115433 type:complete len:677 (-) comp21565_c0_seq1:183-2213(-)
MEVGSSDDDVVYETDESEDLDIEGAAEIDSSHHRSQSSSCPGAAPNSKRQRFRRHSSISSEVFAGDLAADLIFLQRRWSYQSLQVSLVATPDTSPTTNADVTGTATTGNSTRISTHSSDNSHASETFCEPEPQDREPTVSPARRRLGLPPFPKVPKFPSKVKRPIGGPRALPDFPRTGIGRGSLSTKAGSRSKPKKPQHSAVTQFNNRRVSTEIELNLPQCVLTDGTAVHRSANDETLCPSDHTPSPPKIRLDTGSMGGRAGDAVSLTFHPLQMAVGATVRPLQPPLNAVTAFPLSAPRRTTLHTGEVAALSSPEPVPQSKGTSSTRKKRSSRTSKPQPTRPRHAKRKAVLDVDGFEVGMKLEAHDVRSRQVCVATVADIDVGDQRIFITFDGWRSQASFWAELSDASMLARLHHAGWCESVVPPHGFNGVFEWNSYLRESESRRVPWKVISKAVARAGRLSRADSVSAQPSPTRSALPSSNKRACVFVEASPQPSTPKKAATPSLIKPSTPRASVIPGTGDSDGSRRALLAGLDWQSRDISKQSSPCQVTRGTGEFAVHGLLRGMRLEADDIKTAGFTCVASVRDIDPTAQRIRISFDGWPSTYDYWVDTESAEEWSRLHPIGWSKSTGRKLEVPPGFDSFEGPFCWTKYLEQTQSRPAPESAFLTSPAIELPHS